MVNDFVYNGVALDEGDNSHPATTIRAVEGGQLHRPCGSFPPRYATLATARVIFNHLDYDEKQITFTSASGELKVTTSNDLITLDFPSTPPSPAEITTALIQGLGARPNEVHKSRDYLALFDSEDDILSIEPDFETHIFIWYD